MPRPPASRSNDVLAAAVLFAAALATTVATDDMGFVRDEAFYFAHAETYQDWFVRVENGGEERVKALQHKEILDTWRNNSEHPPLDKILFGFAWRGLGRKLRPVQNIAVGPEGERRLEVGGLGPSHGFQVGSAVTVLSPQEVGKGSQVGPRRLLQGVVTERRPDLAIVKLPIDVDLTKLKTTCAAPGPAADGTIYRTGCEAVERRWSYILSESAAMRLPGAAFGALMVALIYLAARGFFAGRVTAAGVGALRRPFALLAAVGYLCIPQAFWNAHLCTFDTTIAALLLLTTAAWHRALASRPWVYIAAVAWGLALLAKHNALFLPVPLLGHWLWTSVREGRVHLHVEAGRKQRVAYVAAALLFGVLGAWLHPLLGVGFALIALVTPRIRVEIPPVPGVFLAMLLIGPAILVAGWPLLWVDSLDNLLRWIEFHLHHEHYMQYWFGHVLQYPPFPAIYSWSMTALTWPISLLAAFAVGMVAVYGPQRWRRRGQAADHERRQGWLYAEQSTIDGRTPEQRSWDRLVLLSAIWPMALISMPGTPIFGGTKHWMPAFPFMLLIAARGVQAVWQQLCQRWADADGEPKWFGTALSWLLALGLLAPAAQATADTYVHGSAYFNELVGGIPGAATAGMQRQFWGGSTRDGLEYVNAHAPANATIWFHKSAWGAYQMYQREGWFRRDLRYGGGPEGTAMGFFHHQKDHDDFELDLMRDYRHRQPAFQSALSGVPILSVYQRPLPAPAPGAAPAQPVPLPRFALPLPGAATPSLR
ncbi:MAG: glycosyltransferase family 39 protein [Deltaproteobacteria bacterium]|nr:glycosyltransferase family 39 protein [Deltaproteobacteria bacterium]